MPKLWTKNFLIITFENFFVYFTYYLLIVIIAVYATDKFKASPSMAGLSASIFILGAIAGRLYAGHSIERVGHKKMLYGSFAFYLLTTLLYFVVNNLAFLIVVRLLHGAAFGLTSTTTGSIAAEIIPNQRRGEGTGYYALSMTIAAAVGPFIGMFLIQRVNFVSTLIVSTLALSVSFIGAFPLTVPQTGAAEPEDMNLSRFALKDYIEARALPISVITAIICFGYSSILTFLSSYAHSIGLIDVSSFFFMTYAVAILVSRPFTGRAFDLKGENFVVYPTLALFIAALVMLGTAHHGLTLLMAGILTGFGYGNYFACGQALAIKTSPLHRKALATSTYYIFADIGTGIGPFLFGFIIPVLGYRGLYFCMAAIIGATIILYYFLHGRTARD